MVGYRGVDVQLQETARKAYNVKVLAYDVAKKVMILQHFRLSTRLLKNKSSAVAERGDRLTTIKIPKSGVLCPFPWGAGSQSNTIWPDRGLLPYQVSTEVGREKHFQFCALLASLCCGARLLFDPICIIITKFD